MKIKSPLLIALLCVSYWSKAQHVKKEFLHKDPNGFIHVDTTINNNYTVCLIERDGYKPLLVRNIILDKKYYISQHMYKPYEEALRLYGMEHIILIKLKPDVKIINLNQMLDKFHIPKEYYNLPVFVDEQELTHAKTLVAVPDLIESVRIVTNPEDGQKLISIDTNKEY